MASGFPEDDDALKINSAARVMGATVKAGERFIRASYPELANLESPLQNINPDMRRGLFVDYLDIVGPFNPSKAKPASYTKIFICAQKTPQCARKLRE